MNIFGFLATPLGYIMEFLYNIVQNYGVAIIIFTFITRLAMFPLNLKQQKSTARSAAFQPMIKEIQQKWANDRNRQSQEMQKFQEENNLKLTPGCAPMIINMLVFFGIISVIQAPLSYILHMPTDQVNNAVSIVQQVDPDSNINRNAYYQQSVVIGLMKNDPDLFVDGADVVYLVSENDSRTQVNNDNYGITEENGQFIIQYGELVESEGETTGAIRLDGDNVLDEKGDVVFSLTDLVVERVSVDPDWVNEVNDFNFDFLWLDLSAMPSVDNWVYLIMPILSILTMFASQIIVMKTSGQASSGKSMWIMTFGLGAFFCYYAFTVPVGFSLYYTAGNVVQTITQLISKKIYDPEELKAQVIAEYEEKKKAKKAKKKIKVSDAKGKVVEKELSDAEYAKIRLERARQLDEERYNMTEADRKKAEAAVEKADAKEELVEKARKKSGEKQNKNNLENQGEILIAEPGKEEASGIEEAGVIKEIEAPAAIKEQPQTDYKPGRRKRAKEKKQSGETGPSFVEKEQETEASTKNEE